MALCILVDSDNDVAVATGMEAGVVELTMASPEAGVEGIDSRPVDLYVTFAASSSWRSLHK